MISWTSPCTVPRDYFLKHVKGVDGIFCVLTEQINQEVVDAAGPSLKVVGTMSVGFDHIDVPVLKRAGIKLGFTPNVLTDATAETTVAVLLAASRRLFESHQHLLNGNWAKFNWGPTWMVGQGLAGSTVGIVGMGRIGQAVKDRLAPFKVAKFLYFDNYINNGKLFRACSVPASVQTPELIVSSMISVAGASKTDFDSLCRESDFVIANCALTAETREIFNEHAFGLMKSNAVFVNTSRGGVVKQSALVDALRSRKIFAAGLDVMTPEPLPTDHELTKLDNCVVIPHLGSATVESRRDMAELTAKNILAALEGREMPAPIP